MKSPNFYSLRIFSSTKFPFVENIACKVENFARSCQYACIHCFCRNKCRCWMDKMHFSSVEGTWKFHNCLWAENLGKLKLQGMESERNFDKYLEVHKKFITFYIFNMNWSVWLIYNYWISFDFQHKLGEQKQATNWWRDNHADPKYPVNNLK